MSNERLIAEIREGNYTGPIIGIDSGIFYLVGTGFDLLSLWPPDSCEAKVYADGRCDRIFFRRPNRIVRTHNPEFLQAIVDAEHAKALEENV